MVRKLFFSGKIHSEAWFFVRWALFLTVCSLLTPLRGYWFIGLIAIVCILYFFRDPHRVITQAPHAYVGPADGVIVEISQENPPFALKLPEQTWHKMSIFLAPWNVHINRIPVSGHVEEKVYQEGTFHHAASPTSSYCNERLALVIKQASGQKIVCVQIAGFLARRIICHVEEGDEVSVGQRYGLICFGSRVDVYLPLSTQIMVQEGQKVIAGETILGFFS